MRHLVLGIAALVLVADLGCVTPGLTVAAYEPTPLLAPRGGDRLVLVDGEGRRSAKQHVAHMLVDGSRGSFFRAEDRGRSGVKLTLAGDTARVEGGEARSTNELWVRVDVLGWNAEAIVVRDEDDDGSLRELPGLRGRADLQFTVANTAGEILLREHEVRGVFERQVDNRDDDAAREAVIAEAAQVAVTTFLADITPQRRTQFLAFDDGDPGQRHILRNTRDTLPGLEKRLRRYLAKNTSNAIAHHNLAIVLDAQGRFEEALIEHDRALDIVDREGFFDARSDTVRRRTAWERVYGDRPLPEVVDVAPDATPATATTPAAAPAALEVPAPTAPPLPSSAPSEPIAAP